MGPYVRTCISIIINSDGAFPGVPIDTLNLHLLPRVCAPMCLLGSSMKGFSLLRVRKKICIHVCSFVLLTIFKILKTNKTLHFRKYFCGGLFYFYYLNTNVAPHEINELWVTAGTVKFEIPALT